MANETDGVWRTVGGRRIFIKGGQDLASAMKESGKFKKSSKKPRIGDERDKKLNDYLEKYKDKTEGELRTIIHESDDEVEKMSANKLLNDMKEEDKNIAKHIQENKYQQLTGAEEDGLAGLYGKKFDNAEDLARAVQMERNNRIGDFEAELDRMEEEGQNVSMYKEKGWDDEVNYNELVEKIKNNPSQFEQYLNKQESEKTTDENKRYNTNSENLDLSKANDRFLAKSYALYDRDNGKISDEEYQKKLKEIDSHAGEKSISKNSVDNDRETFNKIADFYGYHKLTNEQIEKNLQDAEKKGLYHSKSDIEAMRRYLDRTVIEKDNGSVYAKPGRRWEVLEKDKSAYGKEIYKVRDEKGNVQWKPASDFYDNNSKSNDWVRNAFNQYKKDHPNTKMTLQDFMKNNKK